MEQATLELDNENISIIPFPEELTSKPLDPSCEEEVFLMTEDMNNPFVSSKNDKLELPKSDEDKNASFEPENGDNPFVALLKKGDSKPLESKKEDYPSDPNSPFLPSLLVELVHGIKNTLVSISTNALLALDKPEDAEFRTNSQASIKENIKELDSVLKSLLNYININTPVIKSDNVNLALERVLEANGRQLQNKKIRIIRKCEKHLPETSMHEEQLKFVLNSILQYAILSTPVHGTIGLLTNSPDFRNTGNDKSASPENGKGCIRVAIAFASEKNPVEPLRGVSETSAIPRGRTINLILQLVEEILQKNRGMMTIEADDKKAKTFVILKFPIERRKVIYYEPVII